MISLIELRPGHQETRDLHPDWQPPRKPLMARRILVVEDDALLGMLLAETLSDLDYEVCSVAANEDDAVTEAALYKPNLMIVDVHLGQGSGIAAIQRILASGPVPHIFMSGDTSQVRLLWPDAVTLQKPFKEADLNRAIQRALNLSLPGAVAPP
jgi:DNA-binding response OmpR family regulator